MVERRMDSKSSANTICQPINYLQINHDKVPNERKRFSVCVCFKIHCIDWSPINEQWTSWYMSTLLYGFFLCLGSVSIVKSCTSCWLERHFFLLHRKRVIELRVFSPIPSISRNLISLARNPVNVCISLGMCRLQQITLHETGKNMSSNNNNKTNIINSIFVSHSNCQCMWMCCFLYSSFCPLLFQPSPKHFSSSSSSVAVVVGFCWISGTKARV